MESFPVAAHLWHAAPPASGEKSGAGPLSWVEVAIETPATTDAFLGASLAQDPRKLASRALGAKGGWGACCLFRRSRHSSWIA